MGDDSMVQTIFELKDKWQNELTFLFEGSYGKCRSLEIIGNCFVLTKPLARRIIKELKEEFKI